MLIAERRVWRARLDGGLVAASGEVPFGEDERAVQVEIGLQPAGYGLFALMPGPVGAQGAEGDRVGAALRGEVAAEAEHVSPLCEPQVVQAGQFGETQAFGDEAVRVVADGQVVEAVGRGEAAVEGAGAFGGLGGDVRLPTKRTRSRKLLIARDCTLVKPGSDHSSRRCATSCSTAPGHRSHKEQASKIRRYIIWRTGG